MAQYRPLLRPDLIRLVGCGLGGTRAPLAQPQGHEDSGDTEHEERLDDGTADAAVRQQRVQSFESSHRPPTVYSTISTSIAY